MCNNIKFFICIQLTHDVALVSGAAQRFDKSTRYAVPRPREALCGPIGRCYSAIDQGPCAGPSIRMTYSSHYWKPVPPTPLHPCCPSSLPPSLTTTCLLFDFWFCFYFLFLWVLFSRFHILMKSYGIYLISHIFIWYLNIISSGSNQVVKNGKTSSFFYD